MDALGEAEHLAHYYAVTSNSRQLNLLFAFRTTRHPGSFAMSDRLFHQCAIVHSAVLPFRACDVARTPKSGRCVFSYVVDAVLGV
jgi:hypothetical protein